MVPLTIGGPRRARRRLADLLGESVEWRTARSGRAEWIALESDSVPSGSPRAVFAADENHRERVEQHRPDLIGSVWTLEPPDPLLIARLVDRHRPEPLVSSKRVGVIGYDHKFLRHVLERLESIEGAITDVYEWPKYAVHDEARTAQVVADADVVLCEWAGPNAVYASRNLRPHQRLVVRLHRFELEREDWKDIDIDAVDAVIVVGEGYRRRTLEVTGWPAERLHVVPNTVDVDQFHRPKLPGAERQVGLLGVIPWRKRPDRAFDIVERLRRHDDRFTLSMKGDRPEGHRWIWEDPDHRRRFEVLQQRLDTAPWCRWNPPGPDVASWFRSIGFILSVSDDESFHLAPAEGMASGSFPVIFDWDGADAVYDPRWIVSTTDEAVDAIIRFTEEPPVAVHLDVEAFRPEVVWAQWRRLLFE